MLSIENFSFWLLVRSTNYNPLQERDQSYLKKSYKEGNYKHGQV